MSPLTYERPRLGAALPDDEKRRALEILAVSRETACRLDIFVDVLVKWRRRVSLVSRQALEALWLRHIADSGQLLKFAPQNARIWVDLGSGAGFPGAIIAIMLVESGGSTVNLIESDQRKCAFLTAVSRETGASLNVHCGRIESILPKITGVDVVTSRATANLPQLIEWSAEKIEAGATGLFLKGKHYRGELTGYRVPDRIHLDVEPSLIDSDGSIIVASRK